MNAITETPVVDDWEANGPPWQQAGSFRRDGKPERGRWLATLSWVSMICSILARFGFLAGMSLFLLTPMERYLSRTPLWGAPSRHLFQVVEAVACFGPLAMFFYAVLGLPPGFLAWVVARRDRAERERGERDPSGLPETIEIQRRARQAILFNALCSIPGALVLVGLVMLLVAFR